MAFLSRDMKDNGLIDAEFSNVTDRAYLFEFLDKNGGVERAFTFSLPPQSEEITLPFRKAETKTFGGIHIDDYGVDAERNVLSGDTAGKRVWLSDIEN